MSIDQLAELRKFTYSKMLCENADVLPTIQPNAFLHPFSVVQNTLRYLKYHLK